MFGLDELDIIAEACHRSDCLAVTDEVCQIIILLLSNFFIPIRLGNSGIYILLEILMFIQVYEYITYDNEKHISLASLPGMQERTIITSSLSKTYCVTGKFKLPTHAIQPFFHPINPYLHSWHLYRLENWMGHCSHMYC